MAVIIGSARRSGRVQENRESTKTFRITNMTTIIPRGVRASISQVSYSRATNLFRGTGSDHVASRSTPAGCLLRSFTSKPRVAATPAVSYTRKADDVSTPHQTGSTPIKPASSKAPAAAIDDQSPIKDMTQGLDDEPLILDEGTRQVDWTRSFHGLSAQPFSKEAADVLLAPIDFDDVEVKPDGIIYLPEIKYRRILNRAFGPGGWGLAPRGETIVTGRSVTREYALIAHGRYVEFEPSTGCFGLRLISHR